MTDWCSRAAAGETLGAAQAHALARAAASSESAYRELLAASRERRDRRLAAYPADSAPSAAAAAPSAAAAAPSPVAAEPSAGQPKYHGILTFSPKVFLPLTNLCRNRCDYCSFRRSWGQKGAETFPPEVTSGWLQRGAEQGCLEALFCLGDTPETEYPAYAALLAQWGFASTVDYLAYAGERALERGLLPHTNAGILSRADMARLRQTNVSLGLMLENVSPRLTERGGPHFRAPDKHPRVRLHMLREAGALKIPFTTGILLGIGETLSEQVDSLLSIRALHEQHGHIQEVIIQNFRARPRIPMHQAPEPEDHAIARALALARLILPLEVSLQAPPNLNPGITQLLIDAGLNDFGGISPVTPDYINPLHPWPELTALRERCEAAGFGLAPRLPVYDRYLEESGWVDERLAPHVQSAQQRLSGWFTAHAGEPGGARRPTAPLVTPDASASVSSSVTLTMARPASSGAPLEGAISAPPSAMPNPLETPC
ncbi:MAG: 7,8-didemethyl-8-hydroxy-5-deazariboflavin synthase CofG [Polyangiaceae bacterium]|nr:7,8-didemethyl-8-hydroxy-5-deazariboflavin synthase CofG [Polyangiaceae bacterium]MCW5791335.1 7,8-didemethyl-8-hydroxy-5-deazariboflavin synthase CofG [Polyangiaceae bacterium]